MLTVFTDGSSVAGNPGSTGSAYVVVRDGRLLQARGFPTGHGTNNRSELLAAVHGMRVAIGYLAKGEDLLLVSDSQYLLNGLQNCEMYVRERRPNLPVWKMLHGILKLMGRNNSKCLVYWVRGHAGTNGNTLCDKLANSAATNGCDYVPVQRRET